MTPMTLERTKVDQYRPIIIVCIEQVHLIWLACTGVGYMGWIVAYGWAMWVRLPMSVLVRGGVGAY